MIAAISSGLLLGLWLVGATLPISPPSRSVAWPVDVVAAGLAVYAFGSFYSMAWRHLPIPIAVGMVAHALRWFALSIGASVYAAAFLACLFAGLLMTRLGNRMRLHLAAIAFPPVLSMIPGVFLFRMAAGLMQLAELGTSAPSSLTSVILGEGATAILILVAMGFGLIAPKLWEEAVSPLSHRANKQQAKAEHVRKA